MHTKAMWKLKPVFLVCWTTILRGRPLSWPVRVKITRRGSMLHSGRLQRRKPNGRKLSSKRAKMIGSASKSRRDFNGNASKRPSVSKKVRFLDISYMTLAHLIIVSSERLAEEERLRAEEEAAAAAAEEEKRAAEEKAAELRKQREAERNAALEEARLKQQREDEAEARRQARALERKNPPPAAPASAPIRVGGESAWRRAAPTTSTPGTPVRASNGLPRSESPAAGAAPEGKYRPGGFGRGAAAAPAAGGGGGWREREAARKGESPARVASPASPAATPAAVVTPPRSETPKADDDGFQTVAPKAAAGGGAWRSSRLRGRGGGGL